MFCNKRFKHYEAFFIPNSLLLHSTSPVLSLFLWHFTKSLQKCTKLHFILSVLFICACLCCRAAVKMGLSFSAARPSDSALWDMVVEPGRGAAPNTVSVVCRRKVAVTAKRSVYCAYSAYTCFHQTLHIPFVKQFLHTHEAIFSRCLFCGDVYCHRDFNNRCCYLKEKWSTVCFSVAFTSQGKMNVFRWKEKKREEKEVLCLVMRRLYPFSYNRHFSLRR